MKNATKVAQDSASAATELVRLECCVECFLWNILVSFPLSLPLAQVQDVYAKIAVSVHAPVVLFPFVQEGKDLQQAFMVDLGLVHVEHQITTVEENVAYESYGSLFFQKGTR